MDHATHIPGQDDQAGRTDLEPAASWPEMLAAAHDADTPEPILDLMRPQEEQES